MEVKCANKLEKDLSVRVSDAMYKRIQRVQKIVGMDTISECVRYILASGLDRADLVPKHSEDGMDVLVNLQLDQDDLEIAYTGSDTSMIIEQDKGTGDMIHR